MKKGILFLICLGGGVLFGALFFALFGIEAGYNWTLALICAGGGLFFAVAFFVCWLIVQKFSKPISFENLKAQNRLQEDEKNFEPYEERFHGRILWGKGLKSAVCETYIYLLPEKFHISFFYFRKTYMSEVDYSSLNAEVDGEGFFIFKWQENRFEGRLIDEDAASLLNRLKEKGVHIQNEDPFSEV